MASESSVDMQVPSPELRAGDAGCGLRECGRGSGGRGLQKILDFTERRDPGGPQQFETLAGRSDGRSKNPCEHDQGANGLHHIKTRWILHIIWSVWKGAGSGLLVLCSD